MPSLYAQGAIQNNLFSMFVDEDDGESKVQIGGYDLKKYATGPLQWHDVGPGASFWEVGFGNVRLGGL